MKERNYDLNITANGQPVVQSTEGDPLPWHHKAGDRITFTVDGWEHSGVVKAANKKQAIILANRQHFLREGNTFRELNDSDACTHCGGFICTSDCPSGAIQSSVNQTNKETMTPIAFEALASKEMNDPISCVEGKLKYVNDVKSGTNSKGKWTIQTGTIESGGLSHAYKIMHDHPIITEGDKGKILRFTCKEGPKGKSGVYLDVEKWQKDGEEKTKRVIKVTGSATIEFIGATQEHTSGHQDHSEPRETQDSPPPRSNAAASSSVRNGTHLGTPVKRRALLYFGVMSQVMKAREEALSKGAVLPELTVSDLKDITTHISMTYRGDYGAYAEPIFGKDTSHSPEELAKTPDKKWEADGDQSTEGDAEGTGGTDKPKAKTDPTEKLKTWKDIIHKSGVKLGDADTDSLKKWARWAMTAKNATGKKKATGEAERFMLGMLECAASNKWTASKFFLEDIGGHSGYQDSFTDNDIDRFLGCKVGKLSEDKAEELLARNLDEVVAEIISLIPEETQAEDGGMPD